MHHCSFFDPSALCQARRGGARARGGGMIPTRLGSFRHTPVAKQWLILSVEANRLELVAEGAPNPWP